MATSSREQVLSTAVARQGVTSSEYLVIRESDAGEGQLGMFTKQKIDAGEAILRIDEPLFCMAGKDLGSCDNCFRSKNSAIDGYGGFRGSNSAEDEFVLQSCNGCKEVQYCSRDCQRAAWRKRHKFECKNLCKLSEKAYLNEQLLLAVRILSLRIGGQINDGMWAVLLTLEAQTERQDHLRKTEWPDKFTNTLLKIQEIFDSKFTQDEVNGIFYRVLMNDHVMKTVESHKTGFIIHPFAAMCNHSCNPTAFFFQDGASFCMRSAMDIPEDGEITISYIPLKYGFRYRQTKLLEDYGFLCRCSRCVKELKTIKENPRDFQNTKNLENKQYEMVLVAETILSQETPMEENIKDLSIAISKIARSASPTKHWPESIEPIPSLHFELITCYLLTKNYVEAFRNCLRTLFYYDSITFSQEIDYTKSGHQLSFLMMLYTINTQLQRPDWSTALPPKLQELKPLEGRIGFLRCAYHEMFIGIARKVWGEENRMTIALEMLFLSRWNVSADEMREMRGDEESEINVGRRKALKEVEREVLEWAGLMEPGRSFLLTQE